MWLLLLRLSELCESGKAKKNAAPRQVEKDVIVLTKRYDKTKLPTN